MDAINTYKDTILGAVFVNIVLVGLEALCVSLRPRFDFISFGRGYHMGLSRPLSSWALEAALETNPPDPERSFTGRMVQDSAFR